MKLRYVAILMVMEAILLCAGVSVASRNSSGTMVQINGPYTSGSVISSSVVNARFSDIETEITNSLDRSGRGAMTGQLQLASGTVTTPGLGFSSNTGDGLYRIGANNPGFAVNGSKRQEWNTTGTLVTGTLGASGISTFATGGTKLAIDGATVGSFAGLWAGAAATTPSTTNYFIKSDGSADTTVNSPTTLNFNIAGSGKASVTSGGLIIGSTGTAISASYYGTTSWTPGSIGAGSNATTTIALTGASAGAPCSIALPTGHVNLTILTSGCVITANVCTLFLGNPSAGAITGTTGAATFGCRVFNP